MQDEEAPFMAQKYIPHQQRPSIQNVVYVNDAIDVCSKVICYASTGEML